MTTPADKLLTVAELAKHWKVKLQAVDAMIRDGMVTVPNTRPKRVSLKAAEKFRAGYRSTDGRGGVRANAGRKAPGTTPPDEPPIDEDEDEDVDDDLQAQGEEYVALQKGSLADLKRQAAAEDVLKRKRENAEALGLLVRASDVAVSLTARTEKAARKFKNVPQAVADELAAHLKMPSLARATVERVVREHIAKAFEELNAK